MLIIRLKNGWQLRPEWVDTTTFSSEPTFTKSGTYICVTLLPLFYYAYIYSIRLAICRPWTATDYAIPICGFVIHANTMWDRFLYLVCFGFSITDKCPWTREANFCKEENAVSPVLRDNCIRDRVPRYGIRAPSTIAVIIIPFIFVKKVMYLRCTLNLGRDQGLGRRQCSRWVHRYESPPHPNAYA